MKRSGRLARAAHWHAARGLAVFPLGPGSKKPAIEDWPHAATTDRDQITRWWAEAPYNIGVATGPSNLLVIDLDQPKHTSERVPEPWNGRGAPCGRDVLDLLADDAGQRLPRTWTVTTPSGGQHLYYRQPDAAQLGNTAAKLGWRIDTRGHGGYVVGAGSVTRGQLYRADLTRRPQSSAVTGSSTRSQPVPRHPSMAGVTYQARDGSVRRTDSRRSRDSSTGCSRPRRVSATTTSTPRRTLSVALLRLARSTRRSSETSSCLPRFKSGSAGGKLSAPSNQDSVPDCSARGACDEGARGATPSRRVDQASPGDRGAGGGSARPSVWKTSSDAPCSSSRSEMFSAAQSATASAREMRRVPASTLVTVARFQPISSARSSWRIRARARDARTLPAIKASSSGDLTAPILPA